MIQYGKGYYRIDNFTPDDDGVYNYDLYYNTGYSNYPNGAVNIDEMYFVVSPSKYSHYRCRCYISTRSITITLTPDQEIFERGSIINYIVIGNK